MRKSSVPCYVRNGGEHEIINIPMGQFTRWRLKLLVRELLKNGKTLETFVAAKASDATINLLEGLLKILSLNLKPKENRSTAWGLTTATEKNLKPTQRKDGSEEEDLNLVQFAVSCGLVTIAYLIGAMLHYFEGFYY